jgi:glycosyltransferase involved in cell wall biosynthesis
MRAALRDAGPEERTIESPADTGRAGTGVSDNGPAPSHTHLVVIPSYNSGRLLEQTVRTARAHWAPVWVVSDGSSDGSPAAVEAMARLDPALRVLRLSRNCGKGAAVRYGLEVADARGFTHALIMDADGQHPPDRIAEFMAMSAASPEALVMGRPVFGPDAPWVRVVSRRLSNGIAALMTRRSVGDTLFGFRVYPIRPLLDVMQASQGMRRFDFDPEAVVRLVWDGMPLVHLPTRVRYLSRAEDGVSHFHYLRDNLLLARMYTRLGIAAIGRAWGNLNPTRK